MIEVVMVVRLVGLDGRSCQRALQKKRNSLNAGFIQAGLPQESGTWWGPCPGSELAISPTENADISYEPPSANLLHT
jgi:hypothetical protein